MRSFLPCLYCSGVMRKINEEDYQCVFCERILSYEQYVELTKNRRIENGKRNGTNLAEND